MHAALWIQYVAAMAQERVSSRRRGVSMLEYVLVAAVILVVAVALGKLFAGPVKEMVDNIFDFVDERKSGSALGA